jgi:hypothetical protein
MAGMRDDDGFTAAEGWIDEWESGVVAFAARTQELARRLGEPGDSEPGDCEPGDGESRRIRDVVAETVGRDSAIGRAVLADRG